GRGHHPPGDQRRRHPYGGAVPVALRATSSRVSDHQGARVTERDIVIRGGRVIDATGERETDVRIARGVIAEVAPGLEAGVDADVVDAAGCVVSPGFVDLHAHLREPGMEEAETIESGSRAAARSGFT